MGGDAGQSGGRRRGSQVSIQVGLSARNRGGRQYGCRAHAVEEGLAWSVKGMWRWY